MPKIYQKKRHIRVADTKFGNTFSPDEIAEAKFDLYVKAKEVRHISNSLKKILAMPEELRREWIDQNEDMIASLMNSFMDDSVLAIDGMQLDEESMELSVSLVTEMRATLNMIHQMLADEEVSLS
jgi:hypothetical protein